jgi:membrane protein DedA with SNARE-associated domain
MQTLVDYLIRYGTPLVFLNVFAEQIGLPIPALPTLIVAGALARSGRMSFTHLLLFALLGSVIADYFWFRLGRSQGYRILRTLCRISLSPDSCVRDTEALFERWGLPSLIVAKFIPGFSTVAPPLAGAMQSSTAAFLLYDIAGTLLWAGSGIAVGALFYRVIDRALLALESLGWWGAGTIAVILGLIILIKWLQRIRFYRQLRGARIAPAALRELLDEGRRVVILDVRTGSVRKRDPRRIPGAIVAEPNEIEQRLEGLPPHQEIVLYCT